MRTEIKTSGKLCFACNKKKYYCRTECAKSSRCAEGSTVNDNREEKVEYSLFTAVFMM